MAKHLRQSTGATEKIGVFVDVGDGFTPETGITLGAADEAELLKPGTTNITDISGNSWGAITTADGWYWLTFTTGDTDTCGILTVVVQDDSVCLPVYMEFEVINANVYDSLYAAATTDYLKVDIIQVEGADATDTLIGADGDTLETLSDEIAAIPTTAMRGTDNVVLAGATKAEMDAAHALLATPAQVNTQVLDVLNTDTFAEPSSVPAATASLVDKIAWLCALARNKITQTATTMLLRNDADDGTVGTSTVSDDGTTATRGEFS